MCPSRRRSRRIDTPTVRRGRRPTSSRQAIEEAAGELFLENTYARTTIEQITARAGVSRTSFFNYFDAKSDLLWGDVDAVIDDIAARLDSAARTAQASAPEPAMSMVRSVVLAAASGVSAGRIPLAATQWDVMGARTELLSAGLTRFDRLASLVRRFLTARCPTAQPVQVDAAALALVGAAAAGAGRWASAGTGRGEFGPVLAAAIEPVCRGFDPVLE